MWFIAVVWGFPHSFLHMNLYEYIMLPILYHEFEIYYVFRITHYRDIITLVWVELWMIIWIFLLKLRIIFFAIFFELFFPFILSCSCIIYLPIYIMIFFPVVRHIWELLGNYSVIIMVMVIYHYVEKFWRILVTTNFLYNI